MLALAVVVMVTNVAMGKLAAMMTRKEVIVVVAVVKSAMTGVAGRL